MRAFNRSIVIGAAMLIATASLADAANEMSQMVLIPDPGAIKWGPAPPSLPKGVQISVLAGDPAKPGRFVLRVKAPANTTIAPHTHATAENLTIISGVLYHGMGQTLDKAHGQAVSSGGFVYLPAEMPHSVWTTSEPVEIQPGRDRSASTT